ncbi:GH92 family glycosyl hydrolase [Bacteroides sp.]|uniref:GH92 family glycosyl hydrolase n=1 Tax=Bacteroides sp. TaxID=29523 RepID=UPI0026174579|nr:GH92 family glycosyl hydrolase [Bacteroides sp.]
MRIFFFAVCVVVLGLYGCQSGSAVYERVDYADTQIGVIDTRANNCVIGPRLPYGSIYPSPQTPNGGMDGYHPESPIRGFGQLHVSGTGWGAYGHFLVSPQVGTLVADTAGHDSPHSEDITRPYYYSTFLDRYQTQVEIAPAHYSAMYRFTFPQSDEAGLLFDASQAIPTDIERYMNGKVLESSAQIDVETGKIRMKITYRGGWVNGPYSLYMVGQYDKKASEVGVWCGDSLHVGQTVIQSDTSSQGKHVGVYCKFDTDKKEKVLLKLAISFTGYDRAEALLEQEISKWSFEDVEQQAKQKWEEKFRSIEIEGATREQNVMFYSAMFRFYTLASDRSLDCIDWEKGKPFWDDNYAFWDTFRSAYPLLTLIDEPMMRNNLLALIERYKLNGVVYDGFIGGRDRVVEQGGNDVDHIIVDACLKGVEGVDWKEAYRIVKHNADCRRIGHHNQKTIGDNYVKYKELGWMPEGTMSTSQTLEFAYNDYSAALMALKLGMKDDYERYSQRSHQWRQLWNPSLESHGFKGFIDARRSDGEFVFFEPTRYGGSWTFPFYEATSWTYSYYTPHDMDTLISLMGGADAFVERLNYGFQKGLIDYTNEPGFLTTRAFTHAGRPDLSSYWVHDVMRNGYDLTGYPGNDDTGSMASWYVFCSVGLFPNAGQEYYYLNAPLYSKTTLHLSGGKNLVITANASEKNIYIKSCKVNGKPWNKAIIEHSEIAGGGTIEMELSDVPTEWGKDFK